MAETPHLTVRTHPELLEALDRVAEAEDTSVSEVVRRFLVDALDAAGEGRPRAHPPRRKEREGLSRV